MKAWERDLEGLKQEIYDLQAHRSQAFERAKNETAALIRSVVPFSSNFL